MADRIFISYRRGDEPGFALALYGRLEHLCPKELLFMDVEGGIAAGSDFVETLETKVSQCDVLLALIGQRWLWAEDEHGQRRLDDPNDFVRVEIASALNLGKRVIPVLINKAEMPKTSDLPEPLKPLARRNAVRLTHERFNADVHGLASALLGTEEKENSADVQNAASQAITASSKEVTAAHAVRGLTDMVWIGALSSIISLILLVTIKLTTPLDNLQPNYFFVYITIVAIIVTLLTVWRSRRSTGQPFKGQRRR